MAFNYGDLNPGHHSALIVATDIKGNIQKVIVEFDTIRFDNIAFLKEANKVDLYHAQAHFPDASKNEHGHQVLLDNVNIDGKPYAIQLVWKTGAQKFEINQITQQ